MCRVQSFRGKDPWPEGTDDDQQCQLQLHVSPLHTEAHTLRQVQHNTRAHTHTHRADRGDWLSSVHQCGTIIRGPYLSCLLCEVITSEITIRCVCGTGSHSHIHQPATSVSVLLSSCHSCPCPPDSWVPSLEPRSGFSRKPAPLFDVLSSQESQALKYWLKRWVAGST